MACLTHESATRHFPNGRFVSPSEGDSGPDAPLWSWLADVLPFAEQGALHERRDVPKKTHRGIADAEPPLFLSPSSPLAAPASSTTGLVSGLPIGLTNYQAISGANWGGDAPQSKLHIDTEWRNKGTNGSYDGLESGDGMMHRSDYRRPRAAADICDGMSNAFVFGEALPAAEQSCVCNLRDPAKQGQRGGAGRSEHPDGVLVACSDGSIRFVTNEIDLAVYRALATIVGDEALKQ